MTRTQIYNDVYEAAKGDCSMDFITKEEMIDIISDIENWLSVAENGDTYYYNKEYVLTIEYEVVLWKNKYCREEGESEYITPISSNTDLELIKKEIEKYDISNEGCVEIFEKDEDEPILHYENNQWVVIEK